MTILYIILGLTSAYSVISYYFDNWTWLFEAMLYILIEIPSYLFLIILEGLFD